MKLPGSSRTVSQSPAVRQEDVPTVRLRHHVSMQLYRLTRVIDEIKEEGDPAVLDAAERILWSAVTLLDARR